MKYPDTGIFLFVYYIVCCHSYKSFFFFLPKLFCRFVKEVAYYLILRVEGMFNLIYEYINVFSTVTFNMASVDFGQHLYNLLITAALTSLAKLFSVWNSQVPEQGSNVAFMTYWSDRYKQPGQHNSSGQQTINNVSQLVKRTTNHLQNGYKTTTVGSCM